MSSPNTPYHPVDAGGYGHQDDQPGAYSDNPPSPVHTQLQDPPFHPDGFSEEAVPRPRFLGHAASVDIASRGSLASSFAAPSFNGSDGTSVYALNPLGPNRDSGVGYSSVPYQEDPHDSDFAAGNVSPGRQGRYLEEKRGMYVPPSKSKRKMIIGAIAVGVIIAAIGIVVALYFTVIKKDGKTSSAVGSSNGGDNNNTNGNGNNNNNPTNNLIKFGGDGSTVTFDDGTKMTYSNKFGGTWYWDPQEPFNNNAQAQSWSPPLNQSFKWGQDRIFGSVHRVSLENSALILSFSQRQSWWLACPRTRKFSNDPVRAHWACVDPLFVVHVCDRSSLTFLTLTPREVFQVFSRSTSITLNPR